MKETQQNSKSYKRIFLGILALLIVVFLINYISRLILGIGLWKIPFGYLPDCYFSGGWGRGRNQECDCAGIEIVMSDNAGTDGDSYSVCLGTPTITYLEPEGQDDMRCGFERTQCPDGSYVGKGGPNCELGQCPLVDNQIDTSAQGGGVQADWLTYTDKYNGFTIRYPKDFFLTPSTCAKCAVTISSIPATQQNRLSSDELTIGILAFDKNSAALDEWRDVPFQEESDFSWDNLKGVSRVEKRSDFLQLGKNVEMNVKYVDKGNKTVVIYSYPAGSSIGLVENLILSTLSLK